MGALKENNSSAVLREELWLSYSKVVRHDAIITPSNPGLPLIKNSLRDFLARSFELSQLNYWPMGCRRAGLRLPIFWRTHRPGTSSDPGAIRIANCHEKGRGEW